MSLIDDLKEGEVPVIACGKSKRITPWGELLTTASIVRGAVGCVTDGCVRDVKRITALKFPVFSGGISPLDSRGRGEMIKKDEIVECGGVRVQPGDFIVGDIDGVVVIPQDLGNEVIRKALEKIELEDVVRKELCNGSSLVEVYERYNIL